MTIPLRNRAAQADQVRSELEYRQAELRYQQLQNQIRIEVQNAQFAVTQNRARVESARKARDLAQRTYDIEQKKLALGASTSLTLLESGRDLALAESNLVSAMTTYEKSRVELDRVIGSTLEHNGISMEDAELGRVKNAPIIPGVTGMDK
jgi:outer membrane protein TolC